MLDPHNFQLTDEEAEKLIPPSLWKLNSKGVRVGIESCKEAVRWRLFVLVMITLASHVAYGFLAVLYEDDEIDKLWLAIPLGVLMIVLQAIALIPCYTRSDHATSKLVIAKVLQAYEDKCSDTLLATRKLGISEDFMRELESIRDVSTVRTGEVKAWCENFEKGFEFILSLCYNLDRTQDKHGFTAELVPEFDFEPDDRLVLKLKDFGKDERGRPITQEPEPDKINRLRSDITSGVNPNPHLTSEDGAAPEENAPLEEKAGPEELSIEMGNTTLEG